ncbi:hypothetical protein PV326_003000 [Microctonus aethiopoides]|nr:hypothetical protein PV326_003000 [Microctonus aethiopoides]
MTKILSYYKCNDVIGTRKRLAEDSSRKTAEITKIERHTEIFASMCPDEILDHYDDYNTREYDTTLMLGDISGFTEVAEKYTYMVKGGPSKLTETLNSYIGAMVQEILSHHGDVLKFSGDAFIVMWKFQDGMTMRHVANEAMQTACIIQKHFGTYETDVGITLRDPQRISHYIITGKPVWDVKTAEGLCRGGDILVAPSSWQWANPTDYVFKSLSDGVHTLILASSTMWEHPKEEYTNINSVTPSESIISSSITSNVQPFDSDTPIIANFGNRMQNKEIPLPSDVDYTLRPKVIMVTKQRMKNQLRSYMLWPVIRSVELDEPLEHLTEIRQVVIVFVNVITTNIRKTKLISLANTAYKIVCQIVSDMHGCVNKTSLFDKDLMFLCIFGLRGGKQEFESQIGLHCASKIKATLTNLKYIESVTIGVSTGMTYCGVVGHILRREYTVMGMPVNKAARLMVICDRESFLHSRLEARHFILQKHKSLKGISNVGPIYEFLEEITPINEQSISIYPLLGRENELKIFRMLLVKAKENWRTQKCLSSKNSQNLLIIRGEPRTGKSRLLSEMSENIPKDIACNYITFNENNNTTPFTLIYTIFCVPLGFTVTSTSTDRENLLIAHLHQGHDQNYLCTLNPVFNVEFEVTSHYAELTSQMKKSLLKKCIIKLVDKCFSNELSVIIIDDIHKADKKSLALLDTIIKQNRIIFVLSLQEHEHEFLSTIMDSAKVIDITGLDKWFHAGLACQFLDVIGIPPELEKTIQERSMGNPGWIESYLLSLKQINAIELKKISKKNLRGMGLVIPPLIIKEHTKPKDEVMDEFPERIDGWKMYETSYEGSTISLFGIPPTDDQEVTVCTIRQTLELENVNPELTADVMFLKLFDSLTPLDQILLKSIAVLGETIDRNLVDTLMDKTPIRDIGSSIEKLFKMKILGCAMIEVGRTFRQSLFVSRMRYLDQSIEIKCECTDLEIREELADLPRYASCRLLRFQIAQFREATYRLLTENQKVEFHKKALKYLQRNTRKCVACGGGFFKRLFGQSYYNSPKNSKGKISHSDNFFDLTDYESSYQRNNIIERKENGMKKRPRRFNKSSENKVTPRTFSNVNFTDCRCDSILITAYIQILNHCHGIARVDKVLTTILEFVEVLLATFNIPQASKLLREAELILNQESFELREDKLIIYPCLKAKLKILQAKCYLQSGHINQARKSLEDAMIGMGYHFPKSIVMIKIKTCLLFHRRKLMMMLMNNKMKRIADEDKADYNNQLSHCLCEIYQIFRMTGMREHAQLAAIWSLNAALISNNDFIVLCTAYTNMILTAHEIDQSGMTIFLENDGLTICNKRETDIELHELKAIIMLYLAVCYSYLMKGETSKVSHLAVIILKLSRAVKSVEYELVILPRFIYLLMIQCRYDEIPSLLEKLEFIANSDLDKSGHTWYYALCTDLQLETGIRIVSIDQCEQYYQKEGNTTVNARDFDARGRYFMSMWLWHLRMNDWESANMWRARKKNTATTLHQFSIIAATTALKELEALLIYYVHKVDSRNEIAIHNAFVDIQKQFEVINRLKKIVKPILARYMLLKAYYAMIFGRSRSSLKLLACSKNIAKETGNKLIYAWADHCEKAWTGVLTKTQMNKWKDKCELKSNIDEYSIENYEFLVAFYTLPLPIHKPRYISSIRLSFDKSN